jgi:hypothetical protein
MEPFRIEEVRSPRREMGMTARRQRTKGTIGSFFKEGPGTLRVLEGPL